MYSGLTNVEDIGKYRGLCPNCGNGIQAIELFQQNMKDEEKVITCNKCPICNCIMYREWRSRAGNLYNLLESYPQQRKVSNFSDDIKSVSESFVKIYNEAEIAENNSLLNICGPGYRKALEFLIKDYIIKKHPEKKEEIKSKFISTCIENYIQDDKIKETAKRAVWLGNDETHYEKRWEDREVKDLKSFINLTVYWLESEIQYEKMLTDMP